MKGEVEKYLHAFLSAALDGDKHSTHCTFYLKGRRPGIQWNCVREHRSAMAAETEVSALTENRYLVVCHITIQIKGI
jgi:hypothetical protein